MLPSLAFRNLAHLRSGDAVLRGHPLLYASRAVPDGKENLHSLGICEFGGDASFAALCRAVLEHVSLICAMRIPSQVLYSVVRWVAVVVADIGLARLWGREKRLRDETMCCAPIRLASDFLSKDEGDVSERMNGALEYHGSFADPGARVPPCSALPPPRSDSTVRGDFVHREFGDNAPLRIRCIHGC